MIRNLKVLGLALVAVLAMSAVAASAAQAEVTITPEGGGAASLSGVQTTTHEFKVGTRTLECTTAKFAGSIAGNTNTVTITPEYSGCRTKPVLGITFPVTVTMNGCDYLFHGTEKVAGKEEWKAHVDLVCETGKKVDIHVYKEAPHTEANLLCTITVSPKNGLTTNTITNMEGTPDDLTIHSNVAEIPAEIDKGVGSNPALCGEVGKELKSTYTGTTTLQALVAGNPVKLTVSGE